MTIYDEIKEERFCQDEKWGEEHDDMHATEDWCDFIEAYNVDARQTPARYRKRMIQIASLAVAACESFDRKYSGEKTNGTTTMA